MAYRRTPVPAEYDDDAITLELERIEKALELFELITLVELHVEPLRPRAGNVVLADGTDWDPGSGAGFYGYYGGAWHKLG